MSPSVPSFTSNITAATTHYISSSVVEMKNFFAYLVLPIEQELPLRPTIEKKRNAWPDACFQAFF